MVADNEVDTMKRTSSLGLFSCFVLLALLFCYPPSIQAASIAEDYQRLLSIKTGKATAMAVDGDERVLTVPAGRDELMVTDISGQAFAGLFGLNRPISVAVDSGGRIYAGNSETGAVEVYGPNQQRLFSLGIGEHEFQRPAAIVTDSRGYAYVADAREQVVKVYNASGGRLFSFGGAGSTAGKFNLPAAIAVDEAHGELLVADLPVVESMKGPHEGARVQFFDLAGKYLRSFGQYGIGEGLLIKPLGLAMDGSGRVLVSDAYQNVVQAFDRSGVYLGTIYNLDNPLRTPLSLAIGKKSGALFITSLNSGAVEVYGRPSSHTVTATAGTGGSISPAGKITVANAADLGFTITPDTGYHVDQLLVDGANQGALTQYTLADIVLDHTVEARFALNKYTITASATAGGDISPSGAQQVSYGGDLSFAIIPAEGYEIAKVLVDGASMGAVTSCTFSKVSANHTIVAEFVKKAAYYDLSVSTTGSGSVTTSPAGITCPGDCAETYTADTQVTLTVSPAADQVFAGWYGDCHGAAIDCRLTLDNAKTVKAAFVAATDIDTFELGSLAKFPWISGGDQDQAWTMQDTVQRSGDYAMASPSLPEGEMSFLEVGLNIVTEGEMAFWFKISSTEGIDYLRLAIDGVEQGRWSGEKDWTEARYVVGTGKHLVRWEYVKGTGGSAGDDTAWLDDVSFPGHETPVFPVPDIKVNNEDGPFYLGPEDIATISYAVAVGDRLGEESEWFLLLKGPKGWLCYDAAKKSWHRKRTPFWSGPLYDAYSHKALVELSGLDPGTYNLYFLVDMDINGRPDPSCLVDPALIEVGEN